MSNPWDFNMAKLVVLDVYMDVHLVRELVKAYCPITRVSRKKDKSTIVTINRASSEEAHNSSIHA